MVNIRVSQGIDQCFSQGLRKAIIMEKDILTIFDTLIEQKTIRCGMKVDLVKIIKQSEQSQSTTIFL